MTGTVGRRIAVGYAALLILMVMTAAAGAYALQSTASTFERINEELERTLVSAFGVRSAVDEQIVEYLRFLVSGDAQYRQAWEKTLDQDSALATTLRARAATAEMQAGWDQVLTSLKSLDDAQRAAMAAKEAGNEAEALRVRRERVEPLRAQLVPVLDRLIAAERARSTESQQAAVAAASRVLWGVLAVAGLALGAGIAIAWALTRAITGPLRETINTLASSSTEILAATTQQASGTAETAAAVQETSATVSEVKQTAHLAAEKARAVVESVERTAQVSQDGRRAVDETVDGMRRSKARMENTAERILAVSEQGQVIADIITTVNDIAERSNLLAVNAAIEAAKAGEVGKGFAVVATEVRSLAEQSKEATAQVRNRLLEIQRATQAAVMAAEDGVKTAEAAERVATGAGDSIRLLADGLTEASRAAQQIAASADQQLAGMDQVAIAMQNVQEASSQNLASTRQVERAATDLNDLARRLRDLVVRAGRDPHLGGGLLAGKRPLPISPAD